MMVIDSVKTPKHLDIARALFREYADSLGFDLSFQNFEQELRELPGDYAPPGGRLYLAFEKGRPAGCIALRRLSDEDCEMKRFYVCPLFRGKGLGKRLATLVMGEAREIGYKRILLDTVPAMKRAIRLYRALGFKPIPAYRRNPVPGASFMELVLD
ncbi:MAG TPA: GNAT family N-acetyltransferase [Terriglobia bacterium]|nr:GNAT family N-acetyltransferase [Terriglobia bacterium]